MAGIAQTGQPKCPCCGGVLSHQPECTIFKEAMALIESRRMDVMTANMIATRGFLHVQAMRKNYEQRQSAKGQAGDN